MEERMLKTCYQCEAELTGPQKWSTVNYETLLFSTVETIHDFCSQACLNKWNRENPH